MCRSVNILLDLLENNFEKNMHSLPESINDSVIGSSKVSLLGAACNLGWLNVYSGRLGGILLAMQLNLKASHYKNDWKCKSICLFF